MIFIQRYLYRSDNEIISIQLNPYLDIIAVFTPKYFLKIFILTRWLANANITDVRES